MAPSAPHNAKLKDIATVHRWTGVTSEAVFRTLSDTVVGVARLPSRQIARFQSTTSAISSTRRTAILREAIDTLMSDPAPGAACRIDHTHFFLRNSDGFNCAVIFMDRNT